MRGFCGWFGVEGLWGGGEWLNRIIEGGCSCVLFFVIFCILWFRWRLGCWVFFFLTFAFVAPHGAFMYESGSQSPLCDAICISKNVLRFWWLNECSARILLVVWCRGIYRWQRFTHHNHCEGLFVRFFFRDFLNNYIFISQILIIFVIHMSNSF